MLTHSPIKLEMIGFSRYMCVSVCVRKCAPMRSPKHIQRVKEKKKKVFMRLL